MIQACRRSFNPSLLLIANKPSFPGSEKLFFSRIQAAVKGGVTCVQLKDHINDLATTIETAHRLKTMLNGVPLLINTLHPLEVIQAVGAEGIFLENDFPYAEARNFIGKAGIIGAFAKKIEDIDPLERTGKLDFISMQVFPCIGSDSPLGMEGLNYLLANTPLTTIAVGGLNPSNVEPVYRLLRNRGGVAVGSLITQEDITKVAQKIKAIHQKVLAE